MKKKMMSLALALVMCFTLCLPAYAASPNGGGGRIPPAPAGYTYSSTRKGNTTIDSAWHDGAILAAGVVVGGLPWAVGTVVTISVGVLAGKTYDSLKNTGRMTGYYTEYTYECDDPGIYPYIFVHHAFFFSDSARQQYIGENTYTEYALLPR